MDILVVVGAGEIGRWIADTVLADESPIDATVAFTDRDPAVADDAAAGRDAEAILVDSDDHPRRGVSRGADVGGPSRRRGHTRPAQSGRSSTSPER